MTDTLPAPASPYHRTRSRIYLHRRDCAGSCRPGRPRLARRAQAGRRGQFWPPHRRYAQSLDQLYVILDARPVPTYLPGEKLDPLLELRQNPRLLRAVVAEIRTICKKLGRLPRTRARPGKRRATNCHRGGCLSAGDGLGISPGRDQDLYQPGAEARCAGAERAVGPGSGAQIPVAGRSHHAGQRGHSGCGLAHRGRRRTAEDAHEKPARRWLCRLVYDDRAAGRL